MTLARSQKEELSQFYWQTDMSTRELKQHYGLSKPVYLYVFPLDTDAECPNCGSRLVYRSRAARKRGEKVCPDCGHNARSMYTCRCQYCEQLKAEERRRYEEARHQKELEAFRSRLEETSTQEHVEWALSKLSRRERIFLKSFLQVVEESESPTWQEICDRAGVVSQKTYLEKLTKLGLLHFHPSGGVMSNPAVSPSMIEIKRVRNISKSLRFEVFQRDKHTCQYCGRKPPEVELEVDHLIPVAAGGTDEFENLVTSCRDCNRGKSAKIIEDFTGGYSREDWREVIRHKRLKALEARREQLEEVMQHWAECRGSRSVSSYDAKGIYAFIERYDPEWIKAAISIAAKKRPSNYVKYVAGILRNWGRDGAPDYIENPDSSLEKRKATSKQINYIAGLLGNLGLELGDFYHKDTFEDLTMLDASNLIEALTEMDLDAGG